MRVPESHTVPATSVVGVPKLVAIGASAGGLEALQALLPHLRPNGRTAYVVAQHMAQDAHHELLKTLLQRASPLPVRLMESGEPLQADAVTLIPAGRHAQWLQGAWQLREPSAEFFSTPSIDALFSSLGQGLGSTAVAVVLSGAGSDGAIGARALAHAGARVLVQSPQQARFAGMPQAVLEAVPQARPLAVEDLASVWLPVPPPTRLRPPLAPSDVMDNLLAGIRHVTGVDFSGYKPETLERRLRKRAEETGWHTLHAYAAYACQHPDELVLLQRRFLVSVSAFARDHPAFEALARAWQVSAAAGTPVRRCWVPACASGEEAYTLSLLHAMGREAGHWVGTLEVLGSDLNREALERAERACYSARALRDVPPVLRSRGFGEAGAAGDTLEVRADIRAPVRFEQRDVLRDTPAGPWDTISCRNLLIYLRTPVQERLIDTFHRCLSPGGWLLLSPTETLPQASLGQFVAHDVENRIYRRLA